MKNNEYGQGAPSKADAAMSNDKCPKCGGVLRPADWHLADGVYCLERQLTQLRADKARLQGIVDDLVRWVDNPGAVPIWIRLRILDMLGVEDSTRQAAEAAAKETE